jgi:hypothetical protein
MSLDQFNRSPPTLSTKSPREELRTSTDKITSIRSLLSTERLNATFPARPALVWDVIEEGNLETRYLLLPVTSLGQKSLQEADLTFRQQRIVLPIYPNEHDPLDRTPLRTRPPWTNNTSYQVLRATEKVGDEGIVRDNRGRYVDRRELSRLLDMVELPQVLVFLNKLYAQDIIVPTTSSSHSTSFGQNKSRRATQSIYIPPMRRDVLRNSAQDVEESSFSDDEGLATEMITYLDEDYSSGGRAIEHIVQDWERYHPL